MTKKLSPAERAMKIIDLDKKGAAGLHFTQRFVAVRDGQQFTSAQVTKALAANLGKPRTADAIAEEVGLVKTLERFTDYQSPAAYAQRAKIESGLKAVASSVPKPRCIASGETVHMLLRF